VPGVNYSLFFTDRDIGLYAVVINQETCGDQIIYCPQGELGNDLDTLLFEECILFRIVEQPDLFKLVIAVPEDIFGNVFRTAGIGFPLVAPENDPVLLYGKYPEDF
jgi:hypothetical protein